jgi:hypothetical protein
LLKKEFVHVVPRPAHADRDQPSGHTGYDVMPPAEPHGVGQLPAHIRPRGRCLPGALPGGSQLYIYTCKVMAVLLHFFAKQCCGSGPDLETLQFARWVIFIVRNKY